jgi:hypothetical protein
MNAFKRRSLVSTLRARHTILGGAVLLVAAFSPAQAAAGEGWDWVAAPYLWAAGVSTDIDLPAGQPPAGGVSSDTTFADAVDKLDGAFQIHVEGQGDRFGVFADFTFLGLADENDHPRFRTESDLDTRLFELAAVWSPGEGRYQGLDLFAGLRYIDADLAMQFKPVNTAFPTTTRDVDATFYDFMLGARYTWALSDRWGLTVRGDGSFGDTEGSWNASAVANYKTRRGAWIFGYRYLTVDLEARGNAVDITMSGPMIGYGFKF